MLDTAPDLDRWRLRGHRIEVPEPGSQLAIDDQIFRHHAISQVGRLALIHSGEHLRLALDAVHRRQLYPSSHFTVLRGALVGAAQGVWILSPEARADRRERGLTVLTEMYEQMGKYYKQLEKTHLDADARMRLKDQQRWLDQRKAGVASVRTGKADLNLTDVIASAADRVFVGRERREVPRRLWREMSSDAHVLSWSVFQRSEFGLADRRTGIGEGRAPGSPGHVSEAFMASYFLLKQGWSLFDRRCEEPSQG